MTAAQTIRQGAAPGRRAGMAGRARAAARTLFIGAVFGVSIIPGALAMLELAPRLQAKLRTVAPLAGLEARYHQKVAPIEELRPLAKPPVHWKGRWIDTDINYAAFERWFADNLGLRKLMIRAKDELDFRLFRSSSRVYYGANDELYGRNLADNELPGTEALVDTPAKADAVYQGVLRFAADLKAQGVTMLLIAPIQKQYFTRERLPFFAPRVPDDSHFMALYRRMRQSKDLQFIDVDGMLRANQQHFPIFFRQDFHWTDLMAMTVARETTSRIAQLEGSPVRWRHRMEPEYKPFVGSEARFSARLTGNDEIIEPSLRKTWTERHVTTTRDAAATGFEFETDLLDQPDLLPPACMYGNSFSDGMLRAGLPEHFQSFSKLSRALPLPAVPALIKGRCKYLIVQVLDIQTDRWKSLATR